MNKILTTEDGYDIFQNFENDDQGIPCRVIFCNIPGKCFRKFVYNPAGLTDSEIERRDIEGANIIRHAIIRALKELKNE